MPAILPLRDARLKLRDRLNKTSKKGGGLAEELRRIFVSKLNLRRVYHEL